MLKMNEGPGKIVTIGLRFVLVASLLLLLLATLSETIVLQEPVSPTPTPTDKFFLDTMIVPGTRIGPVTLGLSTKRLTELLGPGQMRPQASGIVHLFPDSGLVVYSENERVVSVTARSPVFKTRGGVGVDSDVDEVLRTLSSDYEMEGSGQEYKLHHWGEGWHLEVKDDKVIYFQITTKLTESKK